MANLYITEQGARVEKEYDRIVVSKNNTVLLDVPVIKVSGVVLVGYVGITTPALQMLLQHGIGLVILNRSGGFLGRLSNDHISNSTLKRAQYRVAGDKAFCLQVARSFAHGKLWNSRVRCLRIAAYKENPPAKKSAEQLKEIIERLPKTQSLAEVRSLEALGSRMYFAVLRSHLKQGWEFPRRQRRPPPDPVNVLLSATYTLLVEAIYSATIIAGLDPYCGFYHSERWGRPALVLDLMEEFRPIVADSVVLTLINKAILSETDFQPGPSERPVILELDGYKKLLKVFGERLRSSITIPSTGHHTTYQRLLELQARAFASAIEGRTNAYEPFRAR
jgi:CRISPR-associated protein Cas1